MTFNYSRRLNRPLLYFKYFTILDLFGIVGGVIIIPLVFGMLVYVFGLVLWFAYTLVFRIGRPPGYGAHYFRSWARPEYYSVGRQPPRRLVVRQ